MDELMNTTPPERFTAADRKFKRRADFREKSSEQYTENQAQTGISTPEMTDLDREAANQLRDWEQP